MPDPNLLTTSIPGPAARVSPQGGMQFPAACPADPTGKVTTGCSLLLSLPSAAYTVPSAPYFPFSTQYISNCTFDANVTAFTGGTSPTVSFIFERLGLDGTWYTVVPSGSTTLAAATFMSVDIGEVTQAFTGGGISPVFGAAHNVFTPTSRVRWTFGGSPTSVTFSLSVYGR